MMKLIVGLGNPGGKYEYTRHNVGFWVIEALVKKLETEKKIKPRFLKRGGKDMAEIFDFFSLKLVRPQTFVGGSGLAVKAIFEEEGIKDTANVYVVHDDLDLPLGKIRLRFGGASGGHRGIDSIIKALGTDKFARIRLGIGRGKLEENRTSDQNFSRHYVEKFVLTPFSKKEIGQVRVMVKKAVQAIILATKAGMEKAMQKFN